MFCYFMQVDGVSALIVQSALSKFASGGCYHAVSLENLHTIDITSYLVSQGYKMDPMDYGWSMDRVKSLATSAMQPLLNTFAALPVKETDGQVMRFSSDMPHRNGSGLAHLERMVRWMREKGFLPGPQHPVGSLPLPRGTKALADSAPAPAPVSMPKMQPIKVAETTPQVTHHFSRRKVKLRGAYQQCTCQGSRGAAPSPTGPCSGSGCRSRHGGLHGLSSLSRCGCGRMCASNRKKKSRGKL